MDFREQLVQCIAKQLREQKSVIDELLEVPPDDTLGDYALPCFQFAKKLEKKPQIIAQEIAKKIRVDFLENVDVQGAYVNFFLNKKDLVAQVLETIKKEKESYGKGQYSKEKIMVEFSQANTHKAFHVGHIRGTSLGESISRILQWCGNPVTRANYQGDTGMHVAKWIWCYTTYHAKEPLQNTMTWIAHIYVDAVKRLVKNPDLQEEVNVINRKLETGEDEKLQELWKKTRQLSLDALSLIYKDLDTRFDSYFFESQVEQRGKALALALEKKGIAAYSDDAVIMNLEQYNKGVWVLLRRDGTVLYSAKDLALAEKKFKEYKIDRSIYVVGKEQELHFYQLFKTLELMGFAQAKKCSYVPVSLVRLPTGKMSSRTGDNILYDDFKQDLVAAAKKEIVKRVTLGKKELEHRAFTIALAAMKYGMLSQDPNKVIIFDKKTAMAFEGNTGPYLLYTYARASSILRKVKHSQKVSIPVVHEKELALIKKIAAFPQLVKRAGNELDPSIIAHYSHQLSQAFNEFYHACKVVGSPTETYRLALVAAFRITLKNALFLLGIPVLEEM